MLGAGQAAAAAPAGLLSEAPPGSLSFHLDLSRPDSGAIMVTLAVKPPDARAVELYWPAGDAVRLDAIQPLDRDGRALPVVHGERSIIVRRPPAGGFLVRYTARPGGAGRHGRQGYVGKDFAVFDGRVLLLPRRLNDFDQARFRFTAPAGWRAFTPYEPGPGGWHRLSIDEPAGVGAELLRTTCLGAGRFDIARRHFGATEVAVHVLADWPDDHKAALTDGTFRLYGHFHERFGFEPWPRFSVAWTPFSGDRHRIFGGVSAISACYEMPRARLRNWELMGHRIAHAINRLPPSGMVLSRDDDDLWFSEGWAGYQEIVATAAAGLVEDEGRWNRLYQRYLEEITVYPEWDVALAREHELDGRGREHLHYRKSPLVMKLLEHHLRRRGVDLQAYVADAYARFRDGRGTLRFRADLESYAGQSLAAFWDRHVRAPGVIVPVWPEAVTPGVEARLAAAPALEIGPERFHPDYLFHLAHHGGFASYREIAAFLQASAARRRQAESLYPDFLNRHRYGLPAGTQHQMDRYERLVLGEGAPAALEPRPHPGTREGRMLARLLAAEAAGRAAPPDTAPVVRILSRGRLYDRAPVERLAVRDHEALYLDITAPASRVAVALIDPQGEMVGRHELTPGNGPWRFPAPDDERALLAAEGVYTVRVRAGTATPVARLFWVRRTGSPARP